MKMTAETQGRRPDDLRNVAVTSILEVTSEFLYVDNIDQLLQKIVKTVSETFGLAKCTIGIRDKESRQFVIRAAYGFEPEREEKIRKIRYSEERMKKDLRPEFKIGRNTYYVPAESWEIEGEDDMIFVTRPERLDRARKMPDEWGEADFIDFMMYEKDGSLLGYLEIDEPDDNKVPGEETLKAIEVFSDLAAIAIQNAEMYRQLKDDRRKIELLIDLIGHDVNNYVQAVSGFIELAMGRPGIPEPARKNLAKAHDQVLNLTKLVTNVKTYARAESLDMKSLHPVDIVATIEEAYVAAEACHQEKTVKLVFEDDDASKYVYANELVKDVFVNIFCNAIKFDPHEKVVIDVNIEPCTEAGMAFWCTSVADRGPGIEDEMKQTIFDRFMKSPQSTLGTGIGLHIVKTLVDAYGGRVWVEDRVKGDRAKGSVLKFTLPKSAEKV